MVDTITSGKVKTYSVTIIEGLNLYEIATLFDERGFYSKDEFLKLVRDKKFIEEVLGETRDSLEGYIFPDTYKISKRNSVKEIIVFDGFKILGYLLSDC